MRSKFQPSRETRLIYWVSEEKRAVGAVQMFQKSVAKELLFTGPIDKSPKILPKFYCATSAVLSLCVVLKWTTDFFHTWGTWKTIIIFKAMVPNYFRKKKRLFFRRLCLGLSSKNNMICQLNCIFQKSTVTKDPPSWVMKWSGPRGVVYCTCTWLVWDGNWE